MSDYNLMDEATAEAIRRELSEMGTLSLLCTIEGTAREIETVEIATDLAMAVVDTGESAVDGAISAYLEEVKGRSRCLPELMALDLQAHLLELLRMAREELMGRGSR